MKTILIVDDEKAIRGLISEILTTAGYAIKEAKDGKEALDVLKQFDIDLIITDIVMPDMEGIEFIREVRSKYQQAIKIIAMSGGKIVDAGTYLKIALRMGANAVLEKPFAVEELLNLVRQTES